MMPTWVKMALSILGVFLGGLTATYQANPAARPLVWVMGGLAPVAGYLIGFYQINPAIRPRRGMKDRETGGGG